MKKFLYYDHSGSKPVLVFETEATGILEADKQLEEATGIDPVKNSLIGCQVVNP